MELEFTGERVVPGMAITYGVIEHLHRYAVAREFCDGTGWTLLEALRSLAGKLTMVVAARRLSTIAGCDNVVDLRTNPSSSQRLQRERR